MAYYNSYYYKKNFGKGFPIYLFLAVVAVIIIAAVPTKEDFAHQGSGQTESKTENNNNKTLGQKDPARYEEQNYHEWSNPAEF